MKRFFDVVVSMAALALLAPILLIAALAIAVTMGKPVLFRQTRPGLRGKSFEVVKFRTMSLGTSDDAARLTAIGQFLRRTSIDEFPQLWNVLRGDMSLVGPRPLLPEYIPLYTQTQFRRHEVRPGITGWAQVNGRNSVSWEKRFELDLWYVDNQSFLLDLRILMMTILKVMRGDGINQQGSATMERFRGSHQ